MHTFQFQSRKMLWEVLFLISFLGVTDKACGATNRIREIRTREAVLYAVPVSKHFFFHALTHSRNRFQQIWFKSFDTRGASFFYRRWNIAKNTLKSEVFIAERLRMKTVITSISFLDPFVIILSISTMKKVSRFQSFLIEVRYLLSFFYKSTELRRFIDNQPK